MKEGLDRMNKNQIKEVSCNLRIEHMDEEYNKLYSLLCSLSTKKDKKEVKEENPDNAVEQNTVEENEVEEIEQNAVEEIEQNEEKVRRKMIKRNDHVLCECCKREFYTDGFLLRHLRHNPKCKKYADRIKMKEYNKMRAGKMNNVLKDELKDTIDVKQDSYSEQKNKQESMPLYKYINECFEKSITGIEALECRFCLEKFVNAYAQYRHYEINKSCNTFAYNEFKKYI